MKKCSVCKEEYEDCMFSPMKTGKNGLQARCKTCINKMNKDRYKKGIEPEKIKKNKIKNMENFWRFGEEKCK